MTKKRKPKPSSEKSVPAAYHRFGLNYDPFTTLSLREHNLDCFIGREDLLDRLTSAMLSLSNAGVAGEPGTGKSSLLQMLRSRVPREFLSVAIGVPLDDAAYFLGELLREMLVTLPRPRGLNLGRVESSLDKGELNKNAIFLVIKRFTARLKKPLIVFVDDLEKIKGDWNQHLSRSDRTLQLLEELKPLMELPRVCFIMSLQDEFYSKVAEVVKDGAEPTVLGLFRHMVRVEPFEQGPLRRILQLRLEKAEFKGSLEDFLEPEVLTLALALSAGNPRRFLYLISEAMVCGNRRKGSRVEYQDLFEAVNEHLKLDRVCKKLLYFLAKAGRATAANTDLQAFMGLDTISISRRLEILTKNRLAEIVEVADGVKVYALPGGNLPVLPIPAAADNRFTRTSDGEKRFDLSGKGGDVS